MRIFAAAHIHPTTNAFVKDYLLPSIEKGELLEVEPCKYPTTPTECEVVNFVNSEGKKITFEIKQLVRGGRWKHPGVFLGGYLKLKIMEQEFAEMKQRVGVKEVRLPRPSVRKIFVPFPQELLNKWGAVVEGPVAYVKIDDDLWRSVDNHRKVAMFASHLDYFLKLRRGVMSAEEFAGLAHMSSDKEFKQMYAPDADAIRQILCAGDSKDIRAVLEEHWGVKGSTAESGAFYLSRSIARVPEWKLREIIKEFGTK